MTGRRHLAQPRRYCEGESGEIGAKSPQIGSILGTSAQNGGETGAARFDFANFPNRQGGHLQEIRDEAADGRTLDLLHGN
jgi:hypothetical protein